MIVLVTLMLFSLVFIGVLLLTSFVRWLITGRKPTLVLFEKPHQLWKNIAKGNANVPKNDGYIIDTEVIEISKDNQLR